MRLYFDTMVWLYSMDATSPFYADAVKLLSTAQTNGHQILSSPLVLGELLVLPRRNGDPFTEAVYRRLLARNTITQITDISSIPDAFADARAHRKLASADALHLALASVANADILVTEDRKLLSNNVPGSTQIRSIGQTVSHL